MPQISPDDEARFSRLLLLPELSEEDLARLRTSRVLVLGAGGLGCPATQSLVAAGIGSLRWADADTVDISNLPRQTLFGPNDVGQPKVLAGARRLRELAPDCHIQAEVVHASEDNLPGWVAEADLVLDCTDRYETRHLINRCCVAANRPLVLASVIQWSGQLLRVRRGEGCYACIFEPGSADGVDAACGAYGVFPTAAGLMGVMQAHLALLTLLGLDGDLGGVFWQFDARRIGLTTMRFSARADCPVCGEQR